jgi:hypothetical protein
MILANYCEKFETLLWRDSFQLYCETFFNKLQEATSFSLLEPVGAGPDPERHIKMMQLGNTVFERMLIAEATPLTFLKPVLTLISSNHH